MEQSSPKILFFGTPEFALPALNRLQDDGFTIIGVVTQPDKPAGRKKTLTPPPVKLAAQKLNLPVYQWPKFDDEAMAEITKLAPDLIIVVAYGKILPKKLLDLPKFGCLNIHPSYLPSYRGPSPIQTAILNGDQFTGVSIIKLDEKMDHGPIITQQEFEILADDNYESLSNSLACEAAGILVKIIPAYISGKLPPVEQNHQVATSTTIIEKEDGRIDWHNDPKVIDRQIRAYYPWPGAWTDVTGQRVKIQRAHLADGQLILDWVQPEGKEPMRYDDYLNGNQPLF